MYRRTFALAVSLVLVVSLVAAIPLAGASTSDGHIYTLDEDTTLTDDDQLQAYDQNGTAVGETARLDLTITVADDQREAGIDAFTPGWGYTWLQLQYNESIERTVRFYLPAEYAEPRVNRGVEAENGDGTTVMLEPVAGNDYTAVTVHFDGETDATVGLNDFFGQYLAVRNDAADWVEGHTGYAPPRPGSSGVDQWQHVPEYAFDGNETTYEIPVPPAPEPPEDEQAETESLDNETRQITASDMTIQYDVSNETEPADWRLVHSCEDRLEPVCVVDQDGNETPVLLASDSDPPPVRYKYDRDRLTETQSAFGELVDGLGDAWSDVTGIFGMVTA